MAKFITRTTKYTDATITVYNTEENALIKRVTFVNGWYKDFNKNGDGWNAIQERGLLNASDILVQVNSARNASEKRRMSLENWLVYSEPCNDDEIDSEDIEEE